MKKSELYSLLWEACNKLRGGVEPARYKDYVLVLLFFKYVSDRYKGQPFAEFTISKGASFEDLIAAKGKSDVGERVDKIIQKFLEDNRLQGSLPDVSFNNPDELGSGKELVDKVSGLIAVFQNPAIDFKNNRASGDDIIGDAYEYFMMKFAQESGKSKGQFYTPSEVSRIIARLIGIGNIRQMPTKKWTLYDPAAGSGSLLIRAADEAPVDENGDSIVTIFGQEKDHATAGLAKMNLILHQKGTGEIKRGNTLVDPAFTDDFGELKKFDFIVMNPPFTGSVFQEEISKDLLGLCKTRKTELLFVALFTKMLKVGGRCACIVPDGVLFGSSKAHQAIRHELVENQQLQAVISMPSGVFRPYAGVSTAILIFTKTNAGGTEKVWFYDMRADGYSLDDKRSEIKENDIPDIIARFHNRDAEADRKRTEQSFFVPKQEIVDNGYDLSINKYKKVEYEAVEYPSTLEIMARLRGLEKEISATMDALEELLNG